MTTDEIRDELARLKGWTRICGVPGMLKEDGDLHLKWKLRHHEQWDHPMPPTLDGANAAFPEGWTGGRGMNPPDRAASWHRWVAWRFDPYTEVQSPDHGRGHEMDDLYALALACRRAMEERK